MRVVAWWFRIVGAFYLLLGVANLYGVLGDHSLVASSLPYPASDDVVRAFAHGWSPFAFELVAIGTFALWASLNPARHLTAVWVIVWLSLFHGIADDLYLIANGFDATQYAAFSLLHVAIIVSGILVARRAGRAEAVPAAAPAPA